MVEAALHMDETQADMKPEDYEDDGNLNLSELPGDLARGLHQRSHRRQATFDFKGRKSLGGGGRSNDD